jgi:hypothetical protein
LDIQRERAGIPRHNNMLRSEREQRWYSDFVEAVA